MNRLGTALITAVALMTAALAGASGAAAAGPVAAKTEVRPAQRLAFFEPRGSNGWKLQITAMLATGKKARPAIGFFTRGPRHEEVQYYGAKGRATADGEIAGTLPGLGRVAVRFEQTSETPVTFVPESGCKAEGKSATLKGYFRGTIKFHGEGGYTTVAAHSVRGQIEVTPREVCRVEKHRLPSFQVAAEEAGLQYVSAGREVGGGSLTFEAWGTGLDLRGKPLTDFSATYRHERGKLMILATTRVLAEEKGVLALTAPNGRPTEAAVDPPAPFRGTANFKLESPTTASWTGDLSVEIPTLGTVSLTETGSWAGACETHCTKTFPEGSGFAIGVAFRRP